MAKPSKSGQDIKLPKNTLKVKSAPSQGVRDAGTDIRKPSSYVRLLQIGDIRNETDVVTALRRLANDERFVSNALFSIVQIAYSGFKVRGYDQSTGAFSPEVTQAAKAIMANMDTLSDYTKGFKKKPTVRQFVETALKEAAISGAVAAELVIGDNQLASHLQAVPYESITFKTKRDSGLVPVQKPASGEDIELDIANFFISELALSANETYAVPMYKACLIDTFQNNDFIDDMRRVVNRVGHSRMVVTLNAEKVKASAPPDTQDDPDKLSEYMLATQEAAQSALSSVAPEDTLVVYDTMESKVHDIGGDKADYVPLMQQVSNMQATSLKAPPSVLGIRSEGSQSLANSETLIYLKIAKSLQGPVSDVMSRALTLAVRLLGVDGYVKFVFDPIELRPEGEREAYLLTRQKRVLELLSLGMISDQEACFDLGRDYDPSMTPLSGTRFYDKQSNATSVDDSVDNTGAMEQTLNSNTPSKAGGKSQ